MARRRGVWSWLSTVRVILALVGLLYAAQVVGSVLLTSCAWVCATVGGVPFDWERVPMVVRVVTVSLWYPFAPMCVVLLALWFWRRRRVPVSSPAAP